MFTRWLNKNLKEEATTNIRRYDSHILKPVDPWFEFIKFPEAESKKTTVFGRTPEQVIKAIRKYRKKHGL